MFAESLSIGIQEAVDAAAIKPFRLLKFTPGPGVGGHCLSVDPSYLSWATKDKAGESLKFVDLANQVNRHMPRCVVQRLKQELNDVGQDLPGSSILFVELAHKPDTGNIRESPFLKIANLIFEERALAQATDDWARVEDGPRAFPKASAGADPA